MKLEQQSHLSSIRSCTAPLEGPLHSLLRVKIFFCRDPNTKRRDPLQRPHLSLGEFLSCRWDSSKWKNHPALSVFKHCFSKLFSAYLNCGNVAFCSRALQTVKGRESLPLNRRMKTSFQIASAFPQVRSLKLQLLSSRRSCWYESGTNRAEVRTRQFRQCSGGSRKRTRRRLPPRASSPCSHGCRCPWRSASCSARRAPASPWGARR